MAIGAAPTAVAEEKQAGDGSLGCMCIACAFRTCLAKARDKDVVSYGGVANVCAKARSWQFAVELSPGALGIFHLFLSLPLEWVKKE